MEKLFESIYNESTCTEKSKAKFLGVEYGTEFKGKIYDSIEHTGIYIPGESKIEDDTVYLFTKFIYKGIVPQPFTISTLTKTGKVYTKDEIDHMLPPPEENAATVDKPLDFDCPECGHHIQGDVDSCPNCGVEFMFD